MADPPSKNPSRSRALNGFAVVLVLAAALTAAAIWLKRDDQTIATATAAPAPVLCRSQRPGAKTC